MPKNTTTKNYRYPGVTPFTTEQSHIFFGRKQDTNELYRLIRREQLVVLYGKSGLGKSSLLNAAIIPLCQEKKDYKPIVIRFGAWTEDSDKTPLDTAKKALTGTESQATYLDKLLPEDNSLWYYAKNHQINNQQQGQPLLLFDQFEELFSYPDEQVAAFQRELAELLKADIPLRFLRKVDSAEILTEEEEEDMESLLQVRIVFAIRSDRLHLLDRLKDYLPMIMRHTYELKALRQKDAEDAILKPARAAGNFVTAPFDYTPEALNILIAYLKDEQDKEGRIEGILLQMLCEYYENRLVAPQKLTLLDRSHIGEPKKVVKKYYEEKINSLADEQQLPARRLIEDGLVSEGEAMRLSLHENFIAPKFNVNKALLAQLVDSRLLRSEPFLRGGYTYELSHDRLVPPVLEARSLRREEETQLAAIQREKTRQQKLEAAQQQAEKERKLREQAEENQQRAQKRTRQAGLLLGVALLALLVAGYFGWNANQQKKEAEAAQESAQENLIKAYEADIKSYKSEIEIAKSNKASFERFKAGNDVIQLETSKIDSLTREIDELEDEIRLLKEQ